jgi:hypothetical protein
LQIEASDLDNERKPEKNIGAKERHFFETNVFPTNLRSLDTFFFRAMSSIPKGAMKHDTEM